MSDERRRPGALIAAAALVVVAVFAGVLFLGVVPPPAFPALADEPDPAIAGTVAYWEAEDRSCLLVVEAAGGTPRRLRCDDRSSAAGLEWTDEGTLVVERYVDSGEERLTIDAGTGEVLDQRITPISPSPPVEEPDDRSIRADGTRVVTDGADGIALLRLVPPSGRPRTLLEVTGPRDYAFWQAEWSPDQRWILVSDSEDRLLIADPETGNARLLVENASLPAWGP
jgi:hypothetical protein